MLTNERLTEIESRHVNNGQFGFVGTAIPSADLAELVKMARRYQAWRDGVLTTEETPVGLMMEGLMYSDEIPTAERFDAMLDQAIEGERGE